MEMEAMIQEYLESCMSRQLRGKTLHSYEQALRMFSAWLEASGIHDVEQIREVSVRKYILSLQTRGKYTGSVNNGALIQCIDDGTEAGVVSLRQRSIVMNTICKIKCPIRSGELIKSMEDRIGGSRQNDDQGAVRRVLL